MEGQEYFRENYCDYERQSSERKLAFYMGLVRKWTPQGETVFELGVGMGHFLQKACEEYVCQGCDINEHGLAEAGSRAPAATIFKGSFECVGTEGRPFAVIAWDVLEHITKLDDALALIRSKLRESGFLIGIVPVYDGPLGWLVRRLDHDPSHVWKLSRAEWIAKLTDRGFRVVECGGVIRRLVFSRWYLHVVWPQCVLRRVGSAFYFVAERQA